MFEPLDHHCLSLAKVKSSNSSLSLCFQLFIVCRLCARKVPWRVKKVDMQSSIFTVFHCLSDCSVSQSTLFFIDYFIEFNFFAFFFLSLHLAHFCSLTASSHVHFNILFYFCIRLTFATRWAILLRRGKKVRE